MACRIKKKFSLYLIAILLFLFPLGNNLNAQSYDYNLPQFGDEFVEMCKQPGKWQTKDWLTLAGIAGGTFALMQVDEDVRSSAQRNRTYETFLPIVIGNKYGEGWGPLLIGTGFLIHGLIKDNSDNIQFGFESIQVFTYSSAITGAVKVLLGRSRPYNNEGAFVYRPINFDYDHSSLPSWHTTIAFSFSTLLSEQTNNLLIKAACFTPAVMTAIARIYYDQHWTSDVFLGAAVGYFVGRFVSELHNKQSEGTILVPPTQNEIRFLIHF